MRSSQVLSVDKVVHAVWVRLVHEKLTSDTGPVCTAADATDKLAIFEPGRGEGNELNLDGDFCRLTGAQLRLGRTWDLLRSV